MFHYTENRNNSKPIVPILARYYSDFLHQPPRQRHSLQHQRHPIPHEENHPAVQEGADHVPQAQADAKHIPQPAHEGQPLVKKEVQQVNPQGAAAHGLQQGAQPPEKGTPERGPPSRQICTGGEHRGGVQHRKEVVEGLGMVLIQHPRQGRLPHRQPRSHQDSPQIGRPQQGQPPPAPKVGDPFPEKISQKRADKYLGIDPPQLKI